VLFKSGLKRSRQIKRTNLKNMIEDKILTPLTSETEGEEEKPEEGGETPEEEKTETGEESS
jgi:hypothetical protein